MPDEGEGVPPAYAVLNPNQRGCNYPDKNLAGVGVAFKLVDALFRERGRESQVNAFLKIVAIGTVADVAKLTGENRTIVALGLKDLPKATNPGSARVDGSSGCGEGTTMTAYDIGFRLGPESMRLVEWMPRAPSWNFLARETIGEARRLAQHLDTRNQERKEVQQQIVDLAIAELESAAVSRRILMWPYRRRGLAPRRDWDRGLERSPNASIGRALCFRSMAMWRMVQAAVSSPITC